MNDCSLLIIRLCLRFPPSVRRQQCISKDHLTPSSPKQIPKLTAPRCTYRFLMLPYLSMDDISSRFSTFQFLHAVCFSVTILLLLYCIVSMHSYSASCSAHQSEAPPVRETQREQSSFERTKRGTWLTS